MAYASLEECLLDLEKNGMLLRIKQEVDPNLEMAAIHLRVYAAGGPAILFEKVQGSKFRAASNIFGTLERSKFIFRNQLHTVQNLIALRNNPMLALKKPLQNWRTALAALKALPLKNPINKPVLFEEINISDLPLIKHWPMDGGAYVTLPQVYTEDVNAPGIMKSNLGMYRIQLTGNDYTLNKEIGLHYQLHRGIGVHQTKANKKSVPLQVSCFVGGPPAHSVSAVMPLPEGISEITFAGILAGRRFRYAYDQNNNCISTDADFVITGEVNSNENKIEGPFGDHLGYYSLQHDFPLMQVKKVYARKNAIWPFTVVGRPPQEDTSFGQLIHEITGSAIEVEIPGLRQVYAVDASGVHPLLLAIGSERYTPYAQTKQSSEILTIANHILGTGQLSLAKFLFITADETNGLDTHDVQNYMQYVLERIHWQRDVHFYTNTSIDTLDYSGDGLNQGSKVVFAAYGEKIRTLCKNVPSILAEKLGTNVSLCMPGIIAIQLEAFTNYEAANVQIEILGNQLRSNVLLIAEVALIVLCNDAAFMEAHINNYLWITYTRSNPNKDIYGVDSFTKDKHWGCNGPLIIDARIKPHHAPPLIKDDATEKKVDALFKQLGLNY
jgi:4-hydroxy-3-polyprenylbenzoate decarboxylase